MSATMMCNACKFTVTSSAVRAEHYSSEWHRYNVKRSVAELPPMPKNIFDSKLAMLKQKQGREAAEKADHKCHDCNKTFHSGGAYSQHLVSKTHLKRVQKKEQHRVSAAKKAAKAADKEAAKEASRQAKAKDEAAAAAAPAIVATNPDESSVCLESGRVFADANARREYQKQSGRTQSIPHSPGAVDRATPPTPMETTDAVTDGVTDGEDKQDKKNVVKGEDGFDYDAEKSLPLKTCLFCNKQCTTIEQSLEHMLKHHGFFIPFVEYLTDVEGLLEYLGAKIGIGRVCLHCNGRGRLSYPTVSACQNHMKSKSHCKIRFEDDDEDDEFVDYYTFPSQGEEGDEGDEDVEMETSTAVGAVKTVRRLAGCNDAGELIMSDGALIGHRDNLRAYKLNVRPTTKEDEIREMLSRYRSLANPGATKAERRAKFSEVEHKFMKKQRRVQNKVSYRANNYSNFVDQTGLY